MTTPNQPAAVFLDRDGTIIEDRGHLQSPDEVIFFPDTIPSLQLLATTFDLFIVTNQSGVAKGVIELADVERVNDFVVDRLRQSGVPIKRVYVCPHSRQDGCPCMKPSPYYLQQAAREFGIDLHRSFTVGDHPHDVELATNAGARGIYVLTGHGSMHVDELTPDIYVSSNIREAAKLIVELSCSPRE